MAVAFVISAYKEPNLLGRLVARLGGRPCAVHIDAKVEAAPFRSALAGRPGVTWLPRHVCHWGLFGHVAASLEGLRWFLTTDRSHVVLLTGQCYPIRPIDEFEAWLGGLGEASIISHDPFPHPRWRTGGYDRVRRLHLRLFGRAWHLPALRRMPEGLVPFGGSSYWCLSRAAAAEVLRRLDASPSLATFFRRVWIPDEIVFQTVLANSRLKDTLINDDVHHIEWEPHQPSPGVITDIGPALASGKWFARKFADETVLDAIDRQRLSPQRGGGTASADRVAESLRAEG